MIDPGHGGIDSGTNGVNGLMEKDMVLAEGLHLSQVLKTRGYTVHMTRDRDVFIPLPERVAIARKWKADLMISLHCDSNPDSSVSGLSIYTLNDGRSDREAAALAKRENQSDVIAGVDLSGGNTPIAPILIDLAQRDTINKSSRFALTALNQLSGATDLLPRSPHRSASLAVLVAPDVPAVLIELGYLSNASDAAQMNTGTNGGRGWPWPSPIRWTAISRRTTLVWWMEKLPLLLPSSRLPRPFSNLGANKRLFSAWKTGYKAVSKDLPMLRRLLIYAGFGAAALAAVGVMAGIFSIYTVTRDLPSVETLQNYNPPVTTRVYAGNGTVLGEYARERRIFVPSTFIPKLVTEAFTSAEDRNFYSHPGIDPSGILRAAIKDVFNTLEHRRLEGASTITQQVAKNFLLNSDVKFSRKIREAILAIRIDATYPKDKILELYLNEIYLGENSYGVASASLNYFGKSLDELDVAEVAFLAALPKAPSSYDPVRNNRGAKERRDWVIGQMAENGYITDEQAKAAQAELLVTQTRAMGSQTADVDYYVEEVRRSLQAVRRQGSI